MLAICFLLKMIVKLEHNSTYIVFLYYILYIYCYILYRRALSSSLYLMKQKLKISFAVEIKKIKKLAKFIFQFVLSFVSNQDCDKTVLILLEFLGF